jgi:hypothetical protein
VLGIEVDDPAFDDDPPRPEPPGGIPLPPDGLLGEGQLGAPAASVEPVASLPGRPTDPVGVAAGLTDRGLDPLHERSVARTGARSAAAGTPDANAEIVGGIAGHTETIWKATSVPQAALRAHRGAAHQYLRWRENGGAVGAAPRERRRSPC